MVPDSMIGLVLVGKYEIVERVGAGGMGSVYKALQKPFDRPVAVKLLAPGLSEDEDVIRRFENEALIISKLHRPHTLTPIDFGRTEDGRMFLVTELLFGEPLNAILKRGPIGAVRTMTMLEQVCGSLDEAHEKGIVHRDLKPPNLFVEQVGGKDYFRVLDFGISKLQEGPSLTGANAFIGTPAYVSPEQARGEAVDHLSDIYSLGVIAHECLTGKPLFSAGNHMGVLYKHIHDPAPPLEGVPEPLASLVLQMLEKLPERRPQTASEIIELLHRKAHPPGTGGSSVLPSNPMPAPEVGAETFGQTVLPRERRWPVAGIALALIAVVTAAGAFLFLRAPEAVIAVPVTDDPPAVHRAVKAPATPEPEKRAEPAEPPPAPDQHRQRAGRIRKPALSRHSAGGGGAKDRPTKIPAEEQPTTKEAPPPEPPEQLPESRLTIEVLTTGGRSLRAAVWIDGNRVDGTAPLTVPVPQGKHTVKIEAPGYPPKERAVELNADRKVRFIADL
jgi:serine/threonine-protein kinase